MLGASIGRTLAPAGWDGPTAQARPLSGMGRYDSCDSRGVIYDGP